MTPHAMIRFLGLPMTLGYDFTLTSLFSGRDHFPLTYSGEGVVKVRLYSGEFLMKRCHDARDIAMHLHKQLAQASTPAEFDRVAMAWRSPKAKVL